MRELKMKMEMMVVKMLMMMRRLKDNDDTALKFDRLQCALNFNHGIPPPNTTNPPPSLLLLAYAFHSLNYITYFNTIIIRTLVTITIGAAACIIGTTATATSATTTATAIV